MGGTEQLTALTEPQWMEDIFELCEAWPGVIKVINYCIWRGGNKCDLIYL